MERENTYEKLCPYVERAKKWMNRLLGTCITVHMI